MRGGTLKDQQEELNAEVSRFLEAHPQFELCTKPLFDYVRSIVRYARMKDLSVSLEEMMSVIAQVSNIQARLGQRMKAYRKEDKALLYTLLNKITNGDTAQRKSA